MTWRALTLSGWLAVSAAVAVLVVLIAAGVGLKWDPFGLDARRLRAAETRASVARSDAAARTLEVEGVADQAASLDRLHQRSLAVERATAHATTNARNAHDAASPLDPDRAARLVGHDRELCRLSPAVCDPAAAALAGDGDEVLPAGPSA